MRRKLVALAFAAVLAASIGARAGSSGGWITCNDSGTLHFSPGQTFIPQTLRITFTLDLTDCMSSDASVHGGYVDAAADGVDFTCASGRLANGTATFHWDNGRTSSLEWSGAALAATGTITDGEFHGQSFEGYVVPSADPATLIAACQTPEGNKQIDIAGTDLIGSPAS